MFSTRYRFIFIILFILSGAIIPMADLPAPVSLLFFGAAIFLGIGHFRHGPMLSILFALKKGKIAAAEQSLTGIKKPEWLSKRYKAYYHFAWAVVSTFKQDLGMAKTHSEAALEFGTLQTQEQAILLYNLARVAYEQKAFDQAAEYVAKLDLVEVKDLHLKQRIEEIKKVLN